MSATRPPLGGKRERIASIVSISSLVILILALSAFSWMRPRFNEPGIGMFWDRVSAWRQCRNKQICSRQVRREAHVGTETHDPCQRHLGRRDSLLLGQLVQCIHELEVVVKSLALESGDETLKRSLRNVLRFGEFPRDKAISKWGVA